MSENDDKLYFEDPNCNYDSDYSVLVATEAEARKVDEKITDALKRCARELNCINKQHPKAGIGDTATDECIADRFYQIIHYENHGV